MGAVILRCAQDLSWGRARILHCAQDDSQRLPARFKKSTCVSPRGRPGHAIFDTYALSRYTTGTRAGTRGGVRTSREDEA